MNAARTGTARSYRGFRTGSAAALLVLALVACGSEAGSSGGSDEPDPEATFRYADITAVDSLDSAKPNSSNAYRWLYPLYDRLLTLGPDGSLQPGLATEWEVQDDGERITLELTEEATFHDGNPIDAAAVKANLERAATLPDATSVVAGPAAKIADVTTPDDWSVVIELKEPESGLLFELAQGLGMMMSPAGFDGDTNSDPIGSGPYKVEKFDPGHALTLTRVDDYWGPSEDRVKSIELNSMPDASTRLNALRDGEIDQAIIDPSQINTAESAGLDVNVVDTLGFMNLYGNVRHSQLEDVRVRRAVSLAIDRQALVGGLTYDTGEPTVELFNSGSPWALGDTDPARDVEEAEALLAEAGYEPGELKLSILILSRPLDKQIGESVQQMLGDAGITAELEVVDPARFGTYMDGGTDMWIGRWNGRPDPAQTIEGITGEQGFLNAGQWAPDELTAQLEQAARLPVGEERDAVITEAHRLVVDEQLTWPLFDDSAIYASHGCELDFEHNIDSIDDYSDLKMRSGCGEAY